MNRNATRRTMRETMPAIESRVSVGVAQWGEWSDWGDCTEACEDRLQTRVRTCNQPQPPVGGDMCPGSDAKIRDCICEAFVSDGTLVSVLIASINSFSQLRNLNVNCYEGCFE